jgi:ERCC4-type nuclease
MSTFSILPLGGFISVSLSLSYLRESNKAQRKKQEALCLSRDYHNNTDTWRNVPECTPHGARHLFKSLEAAAMMLRMGSETLRRVEGVSPAEHTLLYETLNRLEQRAQLCTSYLSRTVVIEGPQGLLIFENNFSPA